MTDVLSSYNQWSHQIMPTIAQKSTRRKLPRLTNDLSSRTTLRKITFYRNGDRYFTGKQMNITLQHYNNLRHLLQELSSTIDLPYGVRRLFTPHHGSEITDLNVLKDGASYVCASFEPFQKIDYTTIHTPRVTFNVESCKYIFFSSSSSSVLRITFTFYSSIYIKTNISFSQISFSP